MCLGSGCPVSNRGVNTASSVHTVVFPRCTRVPVAVLEVIRWDPLCVAKQARGTEAHCLAHGHMAEKSLCSPGLLI